MNLLIDATIPSAVDVPRAVYRYGFRRGFGLGAVLALCLTFGLLDARGCAAPAACGSIVEVDLHAVDSGVGDAATACYTQAQDGAMDLHDCCPEGYQPVGFSIEGAGVVCMVVCP